MAKPATQTKPSARGAKAPTRGRSAAAPPETPLLEWLAAGVGLVLVLAVAGFLVAEILSGDVSPPKMAIERLGVERSGPGYLVQIRVINTGGSAASQVVVEGELSAPGQSPETAEATFDYIPSHSFREGGLFFDSNPSAAQLAVRPRSFVDP